jgi:decaprenyl-phosphate phosphoribosyltransferase
MNGGRHAASRVSPAVLLRACRPRQWAKNVLAFAAPCAAGWLDRPAIAAEAFGAFVALCLVSSATYLVNDVRDREQDRAHPRKRLRPVAAGELTAAAALRTAGVLAIAGIALAGAIRPALGVVLVGYLLLTGSYSLWLRRVVVLDILVIAAGFVIRAVAGGVATDIYLSRWFIIVTACCAIFLVAAKRYAEMLAQSPGESAPLRATLSRYRPWELRLAFIAAAILAIVAYALWAFTRPAHVVWYGLSILPLALWLGRYSRLIAAGAGQAPEELILRDRALLALGAVWIALFVGGVYAS